MYSYYKTNQSIPLYDDCTFSSRVIDYIDSNSMIEVREEIGEWKYIKYTSKEGWIFPLDEYGNTVLEADYKTGKYGIRIGDIITIEPNSSSAFAKDYYGHSITTKNGYTPIVYQVESIVQDPVRVEFKRNGHMYSFELSQVEKFNPQAKSNDGISLLAADTESGETEENNQEKLDTDSVIDKIIQTATTTYQVLTGNSEQTTVAQQTFSTMNVTSIRGVFGMPYQFMNIADWRIDAGTGRDNTYENFGRKYAEKIVARMPLFIMVPGTAEFMAKYTDDERKSAIKSLFGSESSVDSERLNKVLEDSGQYYNFYADWATYYKYVNPLCRIAAGLMKINDKTIPDNTGEPVPLGRFNWRNVASDRFRSMFAYKGGCAFYLNTSPQVSNSWSNDTTKSQLADKVNSISDKVREMKFLMGNVAASGLGFGKTNSQMELWAKQQNAIANKDNNFRNPEAKNGITSMFTDNNIIGSVINGMGELMEGSKMRFPELWSDSRFSQDYSINIKLTSPDCDNLSLYLNIIVPLIHIMCLAAPRSTGVNAYGSPFLVRCFYRGFFNIPMGIITGLNITKGGEGKWSYSNIPTEVDVDISIKDLYDLMMISINNGDDWKTDVNILSNNSLMDYISNACGININELDITRTLLLYKIIYQGKIQDYFPNIGESLDQWVYNKLLRLFGYR